MMRADTIGVGMPVQDADGQPLGAVEALDTETLRVAGTTFPRSAVARTEGGVVYLAPAGVAPVTASTAPAAMGEAFGDDGRMVIPIVEERVDVGIREVDFGEIEIRKRMVEETRMVPVTLRREIVEIVRRDANGVVVATEDVVEGVATPPRT